MKKMKKMKKIVSLIIVLAMILSVFCPVFAADGDEVQKGTITVQNAVDGETYSAYKIFDLKSFSKDDNKYSYYIDLENSPWAEFFTDTGAGTKYVTIDENGLVTAKPGFEDWSDMAKEFAKEALAYATENQIAATQTVTASDNTAQFTDLDLGYYLIDSSVGTLCDLNTTDHDAVVEDKNLEPEITNKVKHQDEEEYVEVISGEIGEKLDFQATIKGKEGAENYKLTIDLEPGLDYDEGTEPVVQARVYDADTQEYTMKTLTKGTEYTLVAGDNGFTVEFSQDFLDTLKDNDQIVTEEGTEDDGDSLEFERDDINSNAAPYITVDYKATLIDDGNAEIYGDAVNAADETREAEDPDTNENISFAQLTYGSNNTVNGKPESETAVSPKDPATVVTYFADIVKTDNSNIAEEGYAEILKSAKFVLHRTQNGTDEIVKLKEVTAADDVSDRTVYRVTNAEDGLAEVVLADVARIEGLRGGVPDENEDNNDTNKWTYYLEEIEAPEGYNLLPARIPVVISENNLPATITRAEEGSTEPDKYTEGGIRVINKTGTVLPRTGGIGTTILYIVGGVLMIGAGVVLVAKKKTGSAK